MADEENNSINADNCESTMNNDAEINRSENIENDTPAREVIPFSDSDKPDIEQLDLSKFRLNIDVPKLNLPRYNFTPILDNYRKIASNLSLITTNLASTISTLLPTFDVLRESVSQMLHNYTETVRAVQTPLISILESFDTSYFSESLRRLAKVISEQYDPDHLKKVLLTVMAESKWFPYAGWIDDIDTLYEISDIVASSRGASNRRTQRIDTVILNYYSKTKIKAIKSSWWHSDMPFHIRKILGQALEAHLRGEYALTITCLATMWEGLILEKLHIVGRQRMAKTKQDFAKLIEENDFGPVFSEFYNEYIVSDCSSEEDVIEGIPNRNGVSHSKYKKYPNKKASLNAILLTDFIIHLEPKQQMEEENGQA